MQLGFQDILKNQLLYYFCGNSGDGEDFVIPETIYAGLFITTGEASSDPVELIVGNKGYARVPVTFSFPVNGVVKNAVQVTFPKAIGGNWGRVTHIGLFASDGANNADEPLRDLLVLQQLSSEEEVDEGNIFELDINAIRINLV